MAYEDINFNDEQYQLLLARADLLATQLDLFGSLSAGNPPSGYLAKDTHPSRSDALKAAPIIRSFILECIKEVSYKGTQSQRFFTTETSWNELPDGTELKTQSDFVEQWKNKAVPFLETIIASLDTLPSSVAAKPNVFFPDSVGPGSPWKDNDNLPGNDIGANALREALPEFIEEAKIFLSSFGNSYFLRRRIAPPPGVTDVGANITTDMALQRNLVPQNGWPADATHYISSLQTDPGSGDKFLPVRLAPHDHPTPLAGGWDDMSYMYLNGDGKLTDKPRGTAVDNGIDIVGVGDPVRVTEVVLGRSGIWVGLGPVQDDIFKMPPMYTTSQDGHARILYTRPEYLRKIHRETTQAGDIQIDPVLSYSLMPFNNDTPRAKIPDGLKLVKPGDNLNWKKLGYGDVQLTYFNFSEYNKKYIPTQTEKLQLNSEDLIIYPRLKYSEGYYYFVSVDGKRKTVGELLNDMSPSTENADTQLQEAKESEAIQMISTLREKALRMVLDYTGKAVDVQDEKYLALKDLHTVNVAQALHQGGAANMKVLFAIPAQVIDALPNDPNPYYDNITTTSDFYESFGSGRDYTFTIRISDVKKVSEQLIKVLTNIKDKLDSFEDEGGSIRNANKVKYNIQSQIERIETFPVIIEEFLMRQVSNTDGRDNLTSHLVDGLKITGDAFLQFGLRDNGEIGPDARQTVSFVLYSPDPQKLAVSDKKELVTLDPFITDNELGGIMSRHGIILKKALPWLRNNFLDVEGCRTLHYFMTHRNIISYNDSTGRDLRINEWIKFLQSYTVPPLMIKLSKERARSVEEIDCNKLIEELLQSGTIVRERDKELRELVENNCGEQYLKAVLKDTSAMDPDASKKSIHLKQLFTKNMNAVGDAFGIELLSELYKNLLHKLDPQGLIALLLACLSNKLGVAMTAEALCEVAIEKLIESVGVEETKKALVKALPQLAIFFPELQQIAVEQRLGMSEPMGPAAFSEQFYNSAAQGGEFSDQFAEDLGEIENQDVFSKAPIAAAMTLAPNPVGDFYVYESVAKMERMGRHIPLVPVWGSTTVQHMASTGGDVDIGSTSYETVEVHHKQGETVFNKTGQPLTIIVEKAQGDTKEEIIPINGSYYLQTGETTTTTKLVAIPEEPVGPPPQGVASLEQIAEQKNFYLEKGFSFQEADAAMVRDGIMMVQQSFVDNIKNPQSVNVVGGIESTLDHLTKLDDKLSNLPPNPNDVNHVSAGPIGNTNQNMADVANAAEQAKQFVQYLKQIVNLQELCEKLVGPLLKAPGLLFSDPDDFTRNWENWADGLKDSLVKQFQFPELNIPTMRMPDNLSTDDLIGGYAKMLLQVLAAMIGMILGEILNLVLRELLETCFEEEEADSAKALQAPSPTGNVPLPVIGQITSDLATDENSPDFAAWLRDVSSFLSPDQLCALLMGEATDNTINIVLGRTEDKWPEVWASGIDNGPDIKTIYIDMGQRLEANGGLEVCNAIRATTPILVDFCQADYDYDGRCAELQLQGLTKDECDEIIRQEIEDLRNKIMDLSSTLFPGENILQGALPEPCGENGYFVLPGAMQDTMSRVTDNILQAVKTALIGDMSSLKFFSMPPRSLIAQTDPEVLSKTYNTVMDVMEEKHEIDCVIPICHNPLEVLADAYERFDSWDDITNWTPQGLAKKGYLPLVYSSRGVRRLQQVLNNYNVLGQPILPPDLGPTAQRTSEQFSSDFAYLTQGLLVADTGASVTLYSKATSLELGKEVYKSMPDPDAVIAESSQRSPFKNDHITRMYTIGDLFSSAGLQAQTLNYASTMQLVGYNRGNIDEWDTSGYSDFSMPEKFYSMFGKKRAGRISSLFYDFASNNPDAEDYFKSVGGSAFSWDQLVEFPESAGTENPTKWGIEEDIWGAIYHFDNVAKLFSKFCTKQVVRPEDPLEKQNPVAHEYVLTAEEYARTRGFKSQNIGQHKYVLPFPLDAPLSALMPMLGYSSATSETFSDDVGEFKKYIGNIQESLNKLAENGANPYTAFMTTNSYGVTAKIASLTFAELLGSYLGVNTVALNRNLLLTNHNNGADINYRVQRIMNDVFDHEGNIRNHIVRSLALSDGGSPELGYMNTSSIEAFLEVLKYAPSQDSYFIEAFLNMPIGEAIGITKENTRSLFPEWPGMYEAIRESGVYFELVPPERSMNVGVKGMNNDGVGVTKDAWRKLASKIYWFGGMQLRPVAVSFKNFFRDSNNTFENLSAEEVVPSLSSAPTSRKFIEAFDDPKFHPVFPMALYRPTRVRSAESNDFSFASYQFTLDGISKTTKVPGVPSNRYEYSLTNFNPDVMYFPMPFKNPLSTARVVPAMQKLQAAMSNIGFDTLGEDSITITDTIKVSSLDNTLLYQDYTLNSFYTSRKQKIYNSGDLDSHPGENFRLLDDYKISKSRILPYQTDLYVDFDPTSPVKQSQIKESEYDFEFLEEYSDDVYDILTSIGIKDLKDAAMGIYILNGNTDPRSFSSLEGEWAKREIPDSMKEIDTNNVKSFIFAKFMMGKLADLSNQYASSPIDINSKLATVLQYMFATTEYSACKFAYTSKIFGKLRLSRLNQRKYMKKLWSKVLKTPIDADPSPQCKQFVDKLAAATEEDLSKTETDFFNIDSIKPDIMEFYRNSVCRDVYESSGDQYTASQRALIEASLILLVRVYCLELCFAGLISWDAYNLSDIFKEAIIKKILIKNMKSEIRNFDLIIEFANDYVKKKEDLKSVKAFIIKAGQSGLEYIIEQESNNINAVAAKLFNNSKQISTKMQLNTVSSLDDNFQKQLDRVLSNGKAALSAPVLPPSEEIVSQVKAASQLYGQIDYPAINFLTDNIYTHNYSNGMVENRYHYNQPFAPAECVKLHPTQGVGGPGGATQNDFIGKAWPESVHQDFGGLTADLTQKNFLHSVPLSYYPSSTIMSSQENAGGPLAAALLADSSAATRLDIKYKQMYAGDYGPGRPDGEDPTGKPDAFYEYLRHYIDIYGTETLLNEEWSFDAPSNGEDVSISVLNSVVSVEEKIKRILSSKLLCDPSQMVNQHEYLAGNHINSRLGNFIIQPYVKIVDQDDRSGFKSRSFLGNNIEPCDIDDETQGSIAEAETELGNGPVLSSIRSENNPFKAWIYGVVPLSVFNWFMSSAFMPFINNPKNEKIKLLYNDHGIKPFFKELKFGLRLVYVSQFGSLHMSDTVRVNNEYIGVERELKDHFGINGLKSAKSGLVSRTYFLEDEKEETGWLLGRKNGKMNLTSATPSVETYRVPLMFNELHIPVAEVEKDINISSGIVSVAGVERNFDEFCYTNNVSFFQNEVFGFNPEEAFAKAKSFTVKDFFDPQNEEMYKSLVLTPSNFYFKHIAPNLLEELQNTAEFRLLFDHLLPIKRYMALGFLYSSDALLEFINEPTDLLDGTKSTILNIMEDILESSNDYTFIPEGVRNQMANDIAAGLRGTNIKQPGLHKKILEIIWKCMLMILKGFVELTDPAIIIAKQILDVAKLVYDTIIIGIEAGLQVTKQILQSTIDQARSSLMQLEVNLAIMGPSADLSRKSLNDAAGPAIQGGVPQESADFVIGGAAIKEWSITDDDVSKWSVDVDATYVTDESLVELWEPFKNAAIGIQESLAAMLTTKKALDDAQAEMDGSIAEFEEEYKKVKDEMDSIFGSSWLLPATWAALMPSMTPYMGGIVPPPFFVGPPSTIPGMIYLALLLSDAYEEEQSAALEQSKDPNCEDEL